MARKGSHSFGAPAQPADHGQAPHRVDERGIGGIVAMVPALDGADQELMDGVDVRVGVEHHEGGRRGVMHRVAGLRAGLPHRLEQVLGAPHLADDLRTDVRGQRQPAPGEPSRGKAQHPGAGPVDPGQVIHDEDKGRPGRGPPQQGEHGVGNQQLVGRGTGSEPEGHAQGVPVHVTELIEPIEQREQRQVESGEADLLLELRASGAQHHRPRRGQVIRKRVEQRGLAHAGFPRHDQGAAADRGLAEELAQETEFPLPPDQGPGKESKLAHPRPSPAGNAPKGQA
jgi:hypothetical protein